MLTKGIDQTYDNLPEDLKLVTMALSVLITRISSLPKLDRDDLFDLLQQWRKADDPEDQRDIRRAMEEILAQTPIAVREMHEDEAEATTDGLKKWAHSVGKRVREFRENARMSQSELAGKSGLTQSHISRIENAEHNPTRVTLEKIAGALGVSIREFDPSAD